MRRLNLDRRRRDHIQRSVELLAEEFTGVFSRETIDAYVEESLDQFAELEGRRSSCRSWSSALRASACERSPRRRAR